MNTINARVVAEARSFIGTPFHLQGREKGIGVDCIGLIIGVMSNLSVSSAKGEVIRKYDFLNYTVYDGKYYLKQALDEHLKSIKYLEPGNVALFKNNRELYHVGIIGDYPQNNFSLIHTCMKGNQVVEHRLTTELKEKIIAIYKFDQK